MLKEKAKAYARLAEVIHYYLSALVVWSLLPPASRFDGRSFLTLAGFIGSEVCILAALVAFDDLTGYCDGSDAMNYGPGSGRRITRKPLLAGTLTPTEVLHFGWLSTACGALLFFLAVALAPHQPTWVIISGIAYVVVGVQYSGGLKISYHGGQELFIAGLAVALIVLPYGLLTASLPAFVVMQALLFGVGVLLFDVYSNMNDIAGDASVGRPTLAVKLSPFGNAVFITALSLSETVIILAPAVVGVAPYWFPLAMLPVIMLRGVQLFSGLGRGAIVEARRIGVAAHRLIVVLLILVNICTSGWT